VGANAYGGGDDPEAKAVVAALIEEIGFAPIETGTLREGGRRQEPVFNLGLAYGLAKLGTQSGGMVPAAFAQLGTVPGSPLYTLGLGIAIAAVFAWVLGFGATLAEPALNALGLTVEDLTGGAFRKSSAYCRPAWRRMWCAGSAPTTASRKRTSTPREASARSVPGRARWHRPALSWGHPRCGRLAPMMPVPRNPAPSKTRVEASSHSLVPRLRRTRHRAISRVRALRSV
jgi:hypothetical protein